MMGERQVAQEALFYEFRLERHVPSGHWVRAIDRFVDLSEIRTHLRPFYSDIGRPSVDPEPMIRMLLIGYCFGIRSERRLCEEVHLNLAYRWFCRLGLEGDVPDHSTFSKNRHGRFRESDLLRELFETTVRRCIAEGLVGGEGFAVDASLIRADANKQRSAEASEPVAWDDLARTRRSVREYLDTLDEAAWGAASAARPKFVSRSDPAAQWTGALKGHAFFAWWPSYQHLSAVPRAVHCWELLQACPESSLCAGRVERYPPAAPESSNQTSAWSLASSSPRTSRSTRGHLPGCDRPDGDLMSSGHTSRGRDIAGDDCINREGCTRDHDIVVGIKADDGIHGLGPFPGRRIGSAAVSAAAFNVSARWRERFATARPPIPQNTAAGTYPARLGASLPGTPPHRDFGDEARIRWRRDDRAAGDRRRSERPEPRVRRRPREPDAWPGSRPRLPGSPLRR